MATIEGSPMFVVLTMCHCDERTEDGEPDCDDHWAVGIPDGGYYDPETGHVSMARSFTEGFHTRADAQLFADAKNNAGEVMGYIVLTSQADHKTWQPDWDGDLHTDIEAARKEQRAAGGDSGDFAVVVECRKVV